MRSGRIATVGVVLAALSVAGCTTSAAGTPKPGAEVAPSSQSEGGEPTGPAEESLEDLDLCDLLSESDAEELGLPAEGEEVTGGDGCRWNAPSGYATRLLPSPRPYNDVVYPGTPITIGGRQAHQIVQDTPGSLQGDLRDR